MNKTLSLILILTAFLLVACGGTATSQGSPMSDPVMPTLTTDTGWWIDTTGRVSQETLRDLNQKSGAISDMGFQLGGVFFANAASGEVEIANKFGNHNKLGSAGKDNGIAIAVFLDKAGGDGNKPSIGVAVGSGLEGTLNDAKVGRFLDETFVPARKEGRWEQGLVEFVQITERYLTNPNAQEFQDPPADYTWLLWVIVGLVVFFAADGLFFKFAITMFLLEAFASSGSTSSGSGRGGSRLGTGGGFSGGGVSR